MQYRPGLLEGFLAKPGLDLGNFHNRNRVRYQMRVIACLLDAGGRPLPDGFVNARLRRRLGMRGGRGGGTYKSAAVEGVRGTAGDPAVFPRITESVLRLGTG
jgi:hypothetical protein